MALSPKRKAVLCLNLKADLKDEEQHTKRGRGKTQKLLLASHKYETHYLGNLFKYT